MTGRAPQRLGHRLRRQGAVAGEHRRLLRPRGRRCRLPGPPPAPGRAGDLGGPGPGGDRPHPARRRAPDARRGRAPGHRPRPGQDGEGAGAGPPGVPVRRVPARRRRHGRRRRPGSLAAEGGRPVRGGVRGLAGAGTGGRRRPGAAAGGGGRDRRGGRRGADQRRQARAGVEGAGLRRTGRGRRRVLLGEGRRRRVRPGRHHGGRGADPLHPGADGRGGRQGRRSRAPPGEGRRCSCGCRERLPHDRRAGRRPPHLARRRAGRPGRGLPGRRRGGQRRRGHRGDRPHQARPGGVRPPHARRRRDQGGPDLRRADPHRHAHRLRAGTRPARRGGRRAPSGTW